MQEEWRLFEQAVARFVQALDPKAAVSHDVRLPSRRSSRRRQRDVWVKTTYGGHFSISILISCKRYKRKLHEQDIDAFFGELDSSGADKGVLYCLNGCTPGAIESAKSRRIECCRLYLDQPADLPQSLIFRAYCARPSLTFAFSGKMNLPEPKPLRELLARKAADGTSLLTSLGRGISSGQWVKQSPALLPQPGSVRVPIPDDAGAPSGAEIVAGWDWECFRGELEAHRLNGSYNVTTDKFSGSQSGPPVDRLNFPGAGWTQLADDERTHVQQGIVMAMFHSEEMLCEEILRLIGDRTVAAVAAPA